MQSGTHGLAKAPPSNALSLCEYPSWILIIDPWPFQGLLGREDFFLFCLGRHIDSFVGYTGCHRALCLLLRCRSEVSFLPQLIVIVEKLYQELSD